MIIVAGSSNCIYCEYAQELLDYNDIPYEYTPYTSLPEFDTTLYRTVPQIFYRDDRGRIERLTEFGYEGLKNYGIENLRALEVNGDEGYRR